MKSTTRVGAGIALGAWTAGLCVFAIGCGESTTQTMEDAGASVDSAVAIDSFIPIDAFMPTDAGPRIDLAMPIDSGGPRDLGNDFGIDSHVVSRHLRDTLCAPVSMTLCENFTTCGCDVRGPIDVPSCVAQQIAGCGESMDELALAVAAGQYEIQEDLLTACVAELSGAAELCAPLNITASASCALAFSATTPIGSACAGATFGFGCARGAGYCDGSTGFVCRALPEVGATCSSACASPSVCHAGICGDRVVEDGTCASTSECAAGLQCAGGRCLTPRPLGGMCDGTHPCHGGLSCAGGVCVDGFPSCSSGTECDADSSCRGVDTNICSAPRGEGERCTSSDACITGLVCDYVAERCVTPPTAGESCESVSDCAPGYYCEYGDGSSVCQPLPGVGELCVGGGIIIDFAATPTGGRPGRFSRCAEGLACDYSDDGSSDPVCVNRPSVGEPCADDGTCGEGYTCAYPSDGSPATCTTLPGPGDVCYNDVCPLGYWCQYDESTGGSTCVSTYGAGESCDYSAMCSPGLSCIYDSSWSFATCGATPTYGELCPSGECVEGAFCEYTLMDASCVPSFCDLAGGGIETPPVPLSSGGGSSGGSPGADGARIFGMRTR